MRRPTASRAPASMNVRVCRVYELWRLGVVPQIHYAATTLLHLICALGAELVRDAIGLERKSTPKSCFACGEQTHHEKNICQQCGGPLNDFISREWPQI
jgi:ribosomal protein L37E